MKFKLCAITCSALLAACAGPPALDVQTIKASVPVPVPCIDPSKVPAAPDFLSDADLLTGTGEQVVDKLWRDHIERRDYDGLLSPIVQNCSQIPTPAPLFSGMQTN